MEGCVSARSLSVRTAPNKNAPSLYNLSHQTCHQFDARSSDSRYLRLAGQVSEQDERLWVQAKFITGKGILENLPVAP